MGPFVCSVSSILGSRPAVPKSTLFANPSPLTIHLPHKHLRFTLPPFSDPSHEPLPTLNSRFRNSPLRMPAGLVAQRSDLAKRATPALFLVSARHTCTTIRSVKSFHPVRKPCLRPEPSSCLTSNPFRVCWRRHSPFSNTMTGMELRVPVPLSREIKPVPNPLSSAAIVALHCPLGL